MKMKNSINVRELEIRGLYEVTREVRKDNRGDFARLYGVDDLSPTIWPWPIGQVNLSRTEKSGTVRGIHFQVPPYTEAKLVCCVKGRLWDVAVDLRRQSKTYLQHLGLELSASQANALLIPPGFGHGFQTLEDETEIVYIHSSPYQAKSDTGISPFDKSINITWPREATAVSPRDLGLPGVDSAFESLDVENR
jgi:dTDP-4-dehydrorhamnose 3,5-epimerase